MRAFRPGRLVAIDDDEYDADWEEAKQLNIQRYSERAKAGLPLFENIQVTEMSLDAHGYVI